MAETVLEIKGLSKKYKKVQAISNLNMKVEKQMIFGLLGPNGSGKTTLLRLLTTALQPSEGTILYCGKSIAQCRLEYLSDILFIGHQSAVKLMLTAEENLLWLEHIEAVRGR